jgi:hypothetical protein
MDECKRCGLSFIEGLDVVTGLCQDCLRRRKIELLVRIGSGHHAMVKFILNGREVCRQFVNTDTAAALKLVEQVSVEFEEQDR